VVGSKVPPRSDAVQVAALLDSPEIAQLVSELAATRWTGRPGYPIRTMVGMALAKSLYTLPTWTRTVALVAEHAALRAALGCPEPADVPSVHACYRFAAKLRAFKPLLDACLDRVTASLHEQLPELGATVAIDASDMPAYANGQRYLYKGGPERKTYSDPDASWGHRSAVSTRAAGSFYGYKLHQVVCAITGLPLAWRVETAKDSESRFAMPLLDAVTAPRIPAGSRHHGHGLRPRSDLRRLRAARLPPDHPPARDASGESRQAQASGLRARRVDLRRFRRQAPGGQVALSHGGVLPGQPVDRSEPAAYSHPPGDGPLEEAVPAARCGGAGERPAQERVGAAAPAGPAH
jgi:hypothetical protein